MPEPVVTAETNEPEILYQWTARSMHPIIIGYVAAVFICFMGLAEFVVHSRKAVFALATTAFGSIVSIIPSVVSRVEYRFTETGLEKRAENRKKRQQFKALFQWNQLSHIAPFKHGFKYYKHIRTTNPFQRFWKAYISNAFSGEVHMESVDRDRIFKMLEEHGIPFSGNARRRDLDQ